ncbi:MAG TPA: NAD-dependent epimerase/dehydratase family protein [Actinomycetota bacterium]
MGGILITGGAGFVGSNLARSLLASGHDVRVLDDFDAVRTAYLEGLPVRRTNGTIEDPAVVRRAVKGADAVVHLAAMSGVAPSVEHPERDFAVNVHGTFNVLDAVRRAGVPRVVFASSGAVLAGAAPPLAESQIPSVLSPYGASKLYGEAALQAFQSVYGFTGIALRFSNLYGPNCDHKRSVVAEFLRRALHGRPLVIYGNGRQTRDFLHVEDVCRAVEIALRSPSSGVFQLGTGVETSVARLANLVQKAAGRRLDIERRPPRPGEAARNYVDPSKARRVLRWAARVALPDGLAATYAWLRDR